MELNNKNKMTKCTYCQQKKHQKQKYEEELEKEALLECENALLRERINKGTIYTRHDEIQLRNMQKLQMLEKTKIEQENKELEAFWHNVLMKEVKRKEQLELQEAEKLRQEMYKRRMAYDEQISSANKQRRQILEKEREIENNRLHKLKEKMEQDYYNAMKRKKIKQVENRTNYMEGHEMKLRRVRSEKIKEKEMDLRSIRKAEEELQLEQNRKSEQIRKLKLEEGIFVDYYNTERKMADNLDRETDYFISKWKQEEEKRSSEHFNNKQNEKMNEKSNAAQEYKKYLDDRQREIEKERENRSKTMEEVKRAAYRELKKKIEDANQEMIKQIEYRNYLNKQISENQKVMDSELKVIEEKQRPYTKKALAFGDIMKEKFNCSSPRNKPMHPFKKVMNLKSINCEFLPHLDLK